MLIHVSHLTMIQNHLGDIFKNYWNELKFGIENNSEFMWTELNDLFGGSNVEGLKVEVNSQEFYTKAYAENESFSNNNFDLPKKFSDLRDHIRSFVAAVEILVVNGARVNKGQSLDYHLHPHGRKVIAIGGNTMSRGLTLEGLHTSYFIRHARTFDTLMQMGRWFGYRSNYADLCRIITTTEIAVDFGEICYADTIMNENISSMIRSNASPKDFLIKIRQSTTSLAITSKMGVAGPMRLSWAGGEVITNSIARDKNKIVENHNLLIEILDKIKEKIDTTSPIANNKLVFSDVSIEGELNSFKDSYKIENNNGSLDIQKLFEFYKKSGFETVDIAIVGRKPGNQGNYTFLDKEIGLAQRNSKDRKDPNHFKVPNGKLTDANYLSNYIDFENLNLKPKELLSPAIVCAYIKRPIITFVALDPKFFYGKGKIDREKILEGDSLHEGVQELIEENTGEYLAIPFGVSIATPSTLPNSTAINNNYVDVLVNQMVNDNIN